MIGLVRAGAGGDALFEVDYVRALLALAFQFVYHADPLDADWDP